jgi:hypothetical protein
MEDFERDVPIEVRVAGAVNLSHSSSTDH